MQAPRLRYAGDLAKGHLVEVPHDHPASTMPISVVYPKNRQLSPCVRAFVDWLPETVAPKI
jgi:DNA-binding transcriptional LysR family regulator